MTRSTAVLAEMTESVVVLDSGAAATVGELSSSSIEIPAMPTWLLATMILAVTWLWVVAAATGRAAADARLGVPENARGGVSVFPAIPLLPIGLWAFCRLIDHIAGPRSGWIVSAIDGVLGILMLISIRRNRGDLSPNEGDAWQGR